MLKLCGNCVFVEQLLYFCSFVLAGVNYPLYVVLLHFQHILMFSFALFTAGLPGALNNTFGSGKFNYTYTPSSTTANPTAVTPAPDSVSSSNHVSGADSATSGANSGIPRSPRAAPALNSTSKKLSFTAGSSKNRANVTSGADVLSPRAGIQVTAGLKRSNSNHQNVRKFLYLRMQ